MLGAEGFEGDGGVGGGGGEAPSFFKTADTRSVSLSTMLGIN